MKALVVVGQLAHIAACAMSCARRRLAEVVELANKAIALAR